MGNLGVSPLDQVGSIALRQVPNLVREIEIRTTASPPVIIDVENFLFGKAPTTGTAAQAQKVLKPTVIARGGSLGTQVIAPYGQADPDSWQIGATAILVGTVLSGLAVFWMGFAAGRRAR